MDTPSRLRGMARLHAAHNALEVEFWLGQVSGLAPIAGSPLKSAFDDPNIRGIDDSNKQTNKARYSTTL